MIASTGFSQQSLTRSAVHRCLQRHGISRLSEVEGDKPQKKQFRTHLPLFVDAYNHARRLKTLRGLTPYEFVCHTWIKEPDRFRINPSHHSPAPYT